MFKRFSLVLVLLFTFTQVKADNDWCTVCDGNYPILSATKVITLPAWPNCPITVEYRYRECNGVREMWFDSFKYASWPTPPGCTGLDNYLHPTSPTGRYLSYSAMQAVMRDIMDLIADAEFLDWVALNPSVYCPNGYKTFAVNYASCVGYFTVDRPDLQMTELRIAECDSYACCTKEITICLDQATNQPVRTEKYISRGTVPNCSNETPNIPEGIVPIYTTPCQLNCDAH